MIAYDRDSPLIGIHVPKTAGLSTRSVFMRWFGDGFLHHYYDEVHGKMPDKYDLLGMHSRETPILVYGHFNRLRNFGIENYYPEANQFITILRDPFELMVSSYFFTCKVGDNWKDKSRVPKDGLRNYLLNQRINMLNHFPREVTMDNYQELIETKFIEIGITEHLDESMRRIAKKLDMEYAAEALEHHNATERDEETPCELREEVSEKNPLEFAVYKYVLGKYVKQDAE